MSDFYQSLLENNKKWVAEKLAIDPDYFENLHRVQKPPLLWIGCSDSRVPANQIIGAQPGDVFVHRNIANMVIHTDMNMLSVLDYAVNILHIKHIVVCGHYGCGGIKAAMNNKSYGLIDNWIRHIKSVYRVHKEELDAIADEEERTDRFVELNVSEGIFDLAKTSIVQNAWKNNDDLTLHGWVYSVKRGIIQEVVTGIKDNSSLDAVYRLDI
jgi:carbonic anhydrase